jgi:hypothetical protein
VATKLDILVWDDDFERVRALYKRYPGLHIRKAIDRSDFIEGLTHEPTLVIIGQTETNAKQIQQTFEDELTEETTVLIWYVAPDSREVLQKVKQVDLAVASGFSFTNQYLWISTVNILRNG